MKDCFWIVGNRREGAIKAWKGSPRGRAAAARWRRRNRPVGTFVRLICIPPRDD